jgi:beta-lactamase class A
MVAALAADAGVEDVQAWLEADPRRLARLSVRDPARTNAGTAREMTSLLAALWADRAASPEACAAIRRLLRLQVWPHRLASGFPEDAVAGKTGTLPGIRNEAGVVTYPDGARYAVAVFTREASLQSVRPAVDASIGTAARLAIEHLRRGDASP